MDHAEALEAIELAAVEPDGLERLMAGDTPASAAVAGHLAGCRACVAELARIRRTAAIAREVIATAPDPALKAQTLAFVREVGIDRSGGQRAAPSAAAPSAAVVAPASDQAPAIVPAPTIVPAPAAPVDLDARRARRTIPAWLRYGALAAALIVAVGAGFAGANVLRAPDTSRYEIGVLQQTAEATLRLQARPDTVRVALAATADAAGSAGTVLYSPSSGEIVMVASGLADPADGFEYGCWVEVDGQKRRIGRMYAGGDLQAWAGPLDGLADLPSGAVFGVSLVPKGGGQGTPLLTGSSQG